MSRSARTRLSGLMAGQASEYRRGLICHAPTVWPCRGLTAAVTIQAVLAYQSGGSSDVEYALH